MRSRVSHLILHSEKALNAILAKLEHHQKSFSDKKIDDFLARASQRAVVSISTVYKVEEYLLSN